MHAHRLMILALAFLPALALAQAAPPCFSGSGICGPAPIPPAMQQAQAQNWQHLQAIEQQAQAPIAQAQQGLNQFEQQQTQQSQAWAEQQQANTMWQEQMDSEPNPYAPAAVAVGTGLGLVVRAIVEHHREKEAEQEEAYLPVEAKQSLVAFNEQKAQLAAEDAGVAAQAAKVKALYTTLKREVQSGHVSQADAARLHAATLKLTKEQTRMMYAVRTFDGAWGLPAAAATATAPLRP